MNTFSNSFEMLQRTFPSENESISRLRILLSDAISSNSAYSFKRIFDSTEPKSHLVLAEILSELESMNVLKRNYIVISEDGVALAKFLEFKKLPETVFDDEREKDIAVTPDNVEIRYQVGKQ